MNLNSSSQASGSFRNMSTSSSSITPDCMTTSRICSLFSKILFQSPSFAFLNISKVSLMAMAAISSSIRSLIESVSKSPKSNFAISSMTSSISWRAAGSLLPSISLSSSMVCIISSGDMPANIWIASASSGSSIAMASMLMSNSLAALSSTAFVSAALVFLEMPNCAWMEVNARNEMRNGSSILSNNMLMTDGMNTYFNNTVGI
mmetsp:Transcript_20673/g.30510  ORF Transcript_20673/g.30510 Transcript_20673/m.30510 type:complete len:204 (+) Transcript_20673:180-791(+)